jgi:cell division protein FtsQ
MSPLFNIKTVNIIGLTRYSEKEILQKASIVFGQNWYRYVGIDFSDVITFSNTKASNEIIKNLPYVKDVSVKFVPLGKVRIRISERIPEIAVHNRTDNFVIIDNDGVCLENVRVLNNLKIPVLENSKVRNISLGKVIEFDEPYVLENINKLFNLIDIADSNSENKLFNQITSFDFSSVSSTVIVLDSRIKVNIGDITKLNNYKLNFLKEVFFSKIRKEDKGSLDFSKEDKPIFVPE